MVVVMGVAVVDMGVAVVVVDTDVAAVVVAVVVVSYLFIKRTYNPSRKYFDLLIILPRAECCGNSTRTMYVNI